MRALRDLGTAEVLPGASTITGDGKNRSNLDRLALFIIRVVQYACDDGYLRLLLTFNLRRGDAARRP